MAKKRTPEEEEEARLQRERRTKERFGHCEGENDANEDSPDGDFGPSSELARRRMIRDINESNEGDE
jgi:hypothetical protein